ncbi:MAG: hypothetical protein KTR20_11800 [Cellvibrionaceae bacterium]|nr:hypothetical protein [Cellvibrionaceae bacterium]
MMYKQQGMAVALLLIVLLLSLLTMSYFLWSQHQHQAALNTELLQLRDALGDSQEALKSNKIALSEQITASFQRQQQSEALAGELTQAQQQLKKVADQVADQQQKWQAERQRLHASTTAALAEHKTLEQENQQFRQKLADFEALTAANQRLQKELASLASRSLEQSAQLQALTDVQADNTRLVEQVDGVTERLHQQQQAAQRLQREHTDLQQRLTVVTTELDAVNSHCATQHAQLMAENNALTVQLDTVNTQRDQLQQAAAIADKQCVEGEAGKQQ